MDISQFTSGDWLAALSPILLGILGYLFKEHKANARKCQADNARLEKKIGDQSAEYKALMKEAWVEKEQTQVRSNIVMEKVAAAMEKQTEVAATSNALHREVLTELQRRRH